MWTTDGAVIYLPVLELILARSPVRKFGAYAKFRGRAT